MMSKPLIDDVDRKSAVADLGTSVFLAAGAGTGKSTTLVNRIIATLTSDDANVRMGEVVAITFTDKAGAELRHRLRASLEKECAAPNCDPRLRAALAEVDTAQVGTIHSFAQRILRRFALEAELPLGFTLVTDVEATRAKRQRARDVIASLQTLREIDNIVRLYKVRMGALLTLIESVDAQSLRIGPDALDARRAADTVVYRDRALANVGRFMLRFEADCINEDDLLAQKLAEKSRALMNFLGSASTDDLAHAHLHRKDLEFFKGVQGGSAKSFRHQDPKYWRDGWKALAIDLDAVLVAPLETAVRQLLEHAGAVLLEARAARRRSGELEYDDLLSMADELVRQNEAVRARLHAEIKIMMIDEFQDTDPVQWSLIRNITSDPGDDNARPLPGRLIVVGDPKQAIYSFRGADVRTYTSALREFVDPDVPLGMRLQLNSNFRTVKPIIDWVNTVFQSALGSTEVGYEALTPVHDPDHESAGPSVLVLRDPIPTDDSPVGDSKVLEAELIADTIKRAVLDGWQITDRDIDNNRVYTGPARFRDVAVLYPTRTSLNALLNAFDAQGIPYRSSDAALIFDRAVVMGLVHTLRVIADPSDALSLWLALKTPLFGCTDSDLLAFRQAEGKWNGQVHESLLESRVGQSIQAINDLRRNLGGAQPVHIINAVLQQTRIFEVLTHAPRGTFDAACLKMLRTHAQQWQDNGGLGLVEYIETLEDMQSDSSKQQFPAPDDRDDDAVQLMTVFAAKGLEFPIVALAGMTTKRNPKRPTVGIVNPSRIEFSLTSGAESVAYKEWHDNTHRVLEDEERMRVLYVACTRAMDHLIVSLCGETNRYTTGSAGSLLRPHVTSSDSDVREPLADDRTVAHEHRFTAYALASDWLESVKHVRARAAVPFVALPSGTAAGALGLTLNTGTEASFVEPMEDDSGERMTLAARDGAAFGQCLHATMDQVVSGKVGTSDDELSAAAAASMAKVDTSLNVGDIVASAKAALESPVVREALTSPRRWSELYLATPTPESDVALVEGIADLVFEATDGSLVVVDYKTDRTLSENSKQHYAEQLACYGELLQRVIGRPVARRVVVHVPGDKATQYEF